MADAASLADDQISAGQGAIDAVQTFFDTTVVVDEMSAIVLDSLPVGVYRTGPAADTEHAFAGQAFAQVGDGTLGGCASAIR